MTSLRFACVGAVLVLSTSCTSDPVVGGSCDAGADVASCTAEARACESALGDAGPQLEGCRAELVVITADAASCDAALSDAGARLGQCETELGTASANALSCDAALSDAGTQVQTCLGELDTAGMALAGCVTTRDQVSTALLDAGAQLSSCTLTLGATSAALLDAGTQLVTCSDGLASTTIALTDAGTQLVACTAGLASTSSALTDAGTQLASCSTALTDAGAQLSSCSSALTDAGALLSSCASALSDAGTQLVSCSATLSTTSLALTDAGAQLTACVGQLADAGAQLASTQAALDFATGTGCGPTDGGQDLEFWLAPPDVTDLHNSPGGEPLYLRLVSQGAASTVTVSLPANALFTPIVVNLAAGEARSLNLTAFKSQLETRPTNTIANTGLRVQATTPITAVYEVANTSNAEFFTLFGTRALGTSFTIPLNRYSGFNNEASFAAPHQAFASFDIVATQNNTTVRIYSPVALDGHPAQQQFSLTLNAGQTYSAGWTGTGWTLPINHPAGAAVTSDKPIAVSMKDDSVHNPSGGCYDLIGSQLLPDSALGTEFIVGKGWLNATGDESVELMAVQNGTDVFLDGASTPVATLFAGESYRLDLDYLSSGAAFAAYVRTSRPVAAVRYSGFGCEMATALVPPLRCSGSRRVTIARTSTDSFYLELIVPTSAVTAFTITGGGTATINPSQFLAVPGVTGWSNARFLMNTTQMPVDAPFEVVNTNAPFILSVLTGNTAINARLGYSTPYPAPRVAP